MNAYRIVREFVPSLEEDREISNDITRFAHALSDDAVHDRMTRQPDELRLSCARGEAACNRADNTQNRQGYDMEGNRA